MMDMTALSHAPRSKMPRQTAIVSALAISLAAAIALALFRTDQAVGGDWLERAAVPARMLFLVGAATLLLGWAGQTWKDVGLRKPTSLWRTAGLVLGGYLGVGLMFALATQLVLPSLGIAPKTLSLFAGVQGNVAEYLYWLIPVAWGSAAFGEELVFRGFLQSRLQGGMGGFKGAAFAALLLQAIIFGALHSYQGIGGAIVAGGTGLILGAVYLGGRKNLWAPIILHGLVDTISLSAIYFGAAAKIG